MHSVHAESIASLACQFEKAGEGRSADGKKSLLNVGRALLSEKRTVDLKVTGIELLKDASLYMTEIGEQVRPSLVLSRCFLAHDSRGINVVSDPMITINR
jgi:hypothetical protein